MCSLSAIVLLLLVASVPAVDVDPSGYVLYCPCMGRFGNQADHFLGALAFAHGINRTLALPPWVEYRTGSVRSTQVPFDAYFRVEPLLEFHRVVTMENFMSTLAPTVWPPKDRIVFCYTPRKDVADCKAKEGNPFGPFWDTFNVDFVRSEFYRPLHYDSHHHDMTAKWMESYPPSKYPVLAFMGAPASFPVQAENRVLHRYLQWNDVILHKATAFIRNVLPSGPFVGIHLRNGIDWTRACEHVESTPNLFSAPQCLGYQNEYGKITRELCFPSRETVIREVKMVAKEIRAVAVFVASDNDHMLAELNQSLQKFKVRCFRLEPEDPHVDLAILGLANHFIGNCVSSFTAFAKRERDAKGLQSSFFAFPIKGRHEEL